MFLFKSLIYFVVSGYLCVFAAKPTAKPSGLQEIYAKAALCNASDKFIYKNYSCFAKSYSRSVSTFTVIGTTKKPLNNITLVAVLQFKYGLIFRDVIRTPKIDFCDLNRQIALEIDSPNRVIFAVVKYMKTSFPQFFHLCPYSGLDIRNMSPIAASVFTILPSGDYKAIFTVTIFDQYVSHAEFILSVTSHIKETFG